MEHPFPSCIKLPDYLPNGKIINWNGNLYIGQNNIPVQYYFNQTQTLQPTTAALYGLSGGNALPDNVFQNIKSMIDFNATITNSSYIGTGTEEFTLSFNNPVKFLWIYRTSSASGNMVFSYQIIFAVSPIDLLPSEAGTANYYHSTSSSPIRVHSIIWNFEKTSITINQDANMLNNNSNTYYYITIQ